MNLLGFLAAATVAFGAACAFLPWLIRSLKGTSLVGKDLNKADQRLVPEMGGVAVILGFYVGVATLTVLAFNDISGSVYFAALSACLGAGVVGLMDDMFGLRRRSKAILPFVLALPLGAVVYAAKNTMLLGLDIGLLMALMVPLGITSASNAANMLEGLNGLGAGLGVIMTVSMIVLSILKGAEQGLFLLFPLLGALAAFLWFNRYPARVFPGDSMTLFTGATIACAAIIPSPSLKTFGALLFIPMIIEFALKFRGHFKGENYGSPDDRGRLHYEGKIESLTHLVMKIRPAKEWQLVATLWALEAGLASAVVVLAVVF